MRSAKLVAPRQIEIIEDRMPLPTQGEVLVHVKAAGICGSDLHIYQGERPDVLLPRILGHELVGEVESVGGGVTRFSRGDRVTIDPVVSCGSCLSCRRGYDNLCSTVKCLGVQVDGGYCDYIAVPEAKVYALPEGMPWKKAALIEPFSIAAEVLARSEAGKGDKVLVIGSGTIGLCILQAMKFAGTEVMVSDFVDSRLETAKKLGADRTVNSKTENMGKVLREFTEDFGADVVVEAVGIPRLLEESLGYAAPGGRIVVLGFHPEPAKIPEVLVVKKELKVVGSRMNCRRFPLVIEWFDKNQADPEALVSAVYPFERINDAFQDILDAPEKYLKVLVTY